MFEVARAGRSAGSPQILPFCAVIYMFNQLDRSNLGNAQTNGFSDNLGIPASAVNTATTLFFCTYVPFQPVSRGSALSSARGSCSLAALRCVRQEGRTDVLPGHHLLPVGYHVRCFQADSAAIDANAQHHLPGVRQDSGRALCHPVSLALRDCRLMCRILIGLAETGFYPSVLAYMSGFYPRYDCAFRFALFYGFYSIAGAFGGLIAYGIFTNIPNTPTMYSVNPSHDAHSTLMSSGNGCLSSKVSFR